MTDEGNYDWEAFHNAHGKFARYEKAQRLEKRIFQDWGIEPKTWSETPQEIKEILADMHDECEKYEMQMEEVRNWAEDIPI